MELFVFVSILLVKTTLFDENHWTYKEGKLPFETPGWTTCPNDYFPHNGSCHDRYLHRICNGQLISYDDLCNGCEYSLRNVSGECIDEDNLWVCDSKFITKRELCNGRC